MKIELKVKVNTRLRIRTGPSLSHPIIGYLYDGDTIIATGEQKGWYKHSRGWSHSDYLTFVKDLEEKISPPSVVKPPPAVVDNVAKEKSFTPIIPEVLTKMTKKVSTSNYMTEALKDELRSMGWHLNSELDFYNKIHRFGYRDYNGIRSTKEYVFFTKPDLNIYLDNQGNTLNPELSSDTLFSEIHRKCPEVLYQLQRSVTKNSSPFMNLLYNMRRGKVDLPSITSKDIETSSTQFGTRMYYKKHSFESDENHDFSIEFEDHKDLPIYYLFKAWNHYSNMKSIGIVSPKEIYRTNMELHDQISIYKIIVTELGDEILHFSKITGCYPKNTPRDTFSDVSGDKITYNIQWKGHFVEDMDPVIIYEFNYLAKSVSGTNMKLYDSKKGRVDGNWAKIPYIIRQDNKFKKGFTYKLKWRG